MPTRSQFNCKVPFTSIGDEQKEELVSCGISGINIRQIITVIWLFTNVFLFFYAIIGTILDFRTMKNATYLLRMIKPITGHKIFLSNQGLATRTKNVEHFKEGEDILVGSSFSDLHILLMMVDRNLANTPLIELCMQARGLLRIEAKYKKLVAEEDPELSERLSFQSKNERDFGKFIRALVNIMVWHVPEKYNEEVEKLLKNHQISVDGKEE